jgi:hypothetical protein
LLIFLDPRYFLSPNCMRELLCATFRGVPIDVVVEPNTASAMTREAVLRSLLQAEQMYTVWGLQAEMDEWEFSPSGERYAEQLLEHLFSNPLLEWSNLAPFQAVFLRLLAGRLVQTRMEQQPEKTGRGSLSSYGRPKSMISRAANSASLLSPTEGSSITPSDSARSPNARSPNSRSPMNMNPGSTVTSTSASLGTAAAPPQSPTMAGAGPLPARPLSRQSEFRRWSHSQVANWIQQFAASLSDSENDLNGLYVEAEGLLERVDVNASFTLGDLRKHKYHLFVSHNNPGAAEMVHAAAAAFATEPVLMTDDIADIKRKACGCMLLYLNGRTWTNGTTSRQLEAEVKYAIRYGLYVLLAHERPCIDEDASDANNRQPCEFKDFFATTPPALLRANIYGEIAVPLAGGAARPTSMRLLVIAIAKGSSKLGMYRKLSETLGSFSEELSAIRRRKVSRGAVDSTARTSARFARSKASMERFLWRISEYRPSGVDATMVASPNIQEARRPDVVAQGTQGGGVFGRLQTAASQVRKSTSRVPPIRPRVRQECAASSGLNASDSSASMEEEHH